MRFDTEDGVLEIPLERAIVAGWTGRDQAAVDHHVAELAAIGVRPPSRVPLFYRVSVSLFTQDSRIEVVGQTTSGEVEPALIRHRGVLWLGLGSDHTDRALETRSVAKSKQACAKPIAPRLWRLDGLTDRLDALELVAEIDGEAGFTRYQTGTVGGIRPLVSLAQEAPLEEATIMLCGTVPVAGVVRSARLFRMCMIDPVTRMQLEHAYDIVPLPEVA